MNATARRQFDGVAVDAYGVRFFALQVHFNAPQRFVVERPVLEGGDVEAAFKPGVEMLQGVEVEGGGVAGAVVVGGVQPGRVFLQVGADQQVAVVAGQAAQAGQKIGAGVGLEVADGGAGEKHQPGHIGGVAGQVGGEIQRLGVVRAHRVEAHRGVFTGQRAAGVEQALPGNLQGHVAVGAPLVEQNAHLLAATGAGLGDHQVVAQLRRHAGGVLAQQRRLGAGGVILRRAGDGVEQ